MDSKDSGLDFSFSNVFKSSKAVEYVDLDMIAATALNSDCVVFEFAPARIGLQ